MVYSARSGGGQAAGEYENGHDGDLHYPTASTSNSYSVRPVDQTSAPVPSSSRRSAAHPAHHSPTQSYSPIPGSSSFGHGRPAGAGGPSPSPGPSSPAQSSPRPLADSTTSLAPLKTSGSSSGKSPNCAKCGQLMTGQFVRALGLVYHLNCFTCEDCGKVVAAKFFPVGGPEGRQYPLCETDYFRRLKLLCAKCGCALRGSYITALDKKYHTEHFTCFFGPLDSYYEHTGDVYCHFHYSCRFAVKCTGCRVAILKQFVEINRNNTDEHWHPECYMIHKFWNTKLSPPPRKPSTDVAPEGGEAADGADRSPAPPPDPTTDWRLQEASETPQSLRDKQKAMEERVYRIWTILSTFEESSAACISEMLRHVSAAHYVDAVRMAEKFVVHVETLFAAIDDLNKLFRRARAKDFSHVREARMLCKKIVSFFSLLSQSQEAGTRKTGITQELLSLVTGLAHYLKMLIRIALSAALKLEREHAELSAINQFLNRVDRLARDPNAAKPGHSPPQQQNGSDSPKPYGYKSLARAVGPVVGQGEATTDLCEGCRGTVEEESARFGTTMRWHLPCLRCSTCGREATKEVGEAPRPPSPSSGLGPEPCHLSWFRMERRDGSKSGRPVCSSCASEAAVTGFVYVTRLEQFAFLLCVALNNLYRLLRQRGAVPADGVLPESTSEDQSLYESYRDSSEVKRMMSVGLDRKLSATAQVPRRSIVVESPAGNAAQVANEPVSARPTEGGRWPSPRTPGESSTSQPPWPTDAKPPRPPPMVRSPASDLSVHQLGGPQVRPDLTRAISSVRIVDESTPKSNNSPLSAELPPIDDGNITLADLRAVAENERARAEQRPRPVLRQGAALLSELSALEYLIVKYVSALTLGADDSPFRDLAPTDELLELIDDRKSNNFWGKLFKGAGGGKDGKAIKKKGVFNVPLELLVERSGIDSMLGSGATPVRVPSFIDDLIAAMRQMDMSVEGVFRKNGNIRRLKELGDALDRESTNISMVDENPVQLAALLKKFLRELPDPLLTFKLHHLFIATQRVEPPEERARVLHLVCCLLPKAHRDTMEVIFVFLKWVASFSHVDEETGSKMDLQNLATVICPNILYAKGNNPSKDESFLAIRAVAQLLEQQEWFWLVPESMAAILEDSDLVSNLDSLSSRDILSRCREFVTRRRSPSEAPYPSRSAQRGEVTRGEGVMQDSFEPGSGGGRPTSWFVQPNGPQPSARNGRPATPDRHQYQYDR